MSPVPNWDSVDEVRKHTEHSLLFSEMPRVLKHDFEDMMNEVRSGDPDGGESDYSDALRIRGVPDGLQRLELSDEKLYENSIWIVDYDLLFGDVDIDAPIDELRSKLRDNLCPDVVEVRVFVNDPPRNPEEPPAEKVKEEYDIYKLFTCSSYDQLVGSLSTYFHNIDPDRGPAAKRRNFDWARWVKKFAL